MLMSIGVRVRLRTGHEAVAVPGVMAASPPRAVFAALMILPTVLAVLAITAFPFFYSAWLSVNELNQFTKRWTFVGLGNYALTWKSGDLRDAFFRTVIFCVITVIGGTLLGLFIALVLNERFRGPGVLAQRDPDPVVHVGGRGRLPVGLDLQRPVRHAERGARPVRRHPLGYVPWLSMPDTALESWRGLHLEPGPAGGAAVPGRAPGDPAEPVPRRQSGWRAVPCAASGTSRFPGCARWVCW